MTYYKKNDGDKILKWDGENAVKMKMLVDPATNATLGIQIKDFPMTEGEIKAAEWKEIDEAEYDTLRGNKFEDYWLMTAV